MICYIARDNRYTRKQEKNKQQITMRSQKNYLFAYEGLKTNSKLRVFSKNNLKRLKTKFASVNAVLWNAHIQRLANIKVTIEY